MDKVKAEADSSTDAAEKLECAVCLQPCIQPVKLPCLHVFCYLCVKGVAHQSKRCAMCRQEIPTNYLDNPQLIAVTPSNIAFEGSYQWFYEGRNGWWQYDDRTSSEIETAYKKGEQQCEVLIAGYLYIVDFGRGVQTRRCDPSRKRQIKRDLVSIPKKGVAGIREMTEPDLSLAGMTLNDNLDDSSSNSEESLNVNSNLLAENCSTEDLPNISSAS